MFLVEVTGLAPWADAHGKQRVSAVLSSVDTSDLRKLCLLASPRIPYRLSLTYKKGRAKKLSLFCGRGDGIRTHDLLVPNQARYHLRYASYPIIILFFAEVVN